MELAFDLPEPRGGTSRKRVTLDLPLAKIAPDRWERALKQASEAWAESFGVFETPAARHNFEAHRFHYLAARQYKGASFAQLCLWTKLIVWFFYFDDYVDHLKTVTPEHVARASRLIDDSIAVLDGKHCCDASSHRSLLMLEDMVSDARGYGDEHAYWVACYIEYLRHYLIGCRREFDAGLGRGVADAKPMGYAQYINDVRSRTVGLYPFFALHGIAVGMSDDALHRIVEHPDVLAIEEKAVLHCIYTNDLCGLPRDLVQDNPNAIFIYQKEMNTTLSAAIDHCVESANEVTRQIRAAMQTCLRELPAREDQRACLARFFYYINAFMRGIVDWYIESGRYREARQIYDAGEASALARSFTPPAIPFQDVAPLSG